MYPKTRADLMEQVRAARDDGYHCDDLTLYELRVVALGNPFELGTLFIDSDDSVSVDVEDDSADGFHNEPLGIVPGAYAALRAELSAQEEQ